MKPMRAIHVIAAAILAFGCGDDPPPQGKTQKRDGSDPASGKAPRRAPGAPAAAKKDAKAMRVYAKISDDDRREFRERDFIPDPTGAENRDPFRSYVVTQPGLAKKSAEGTLSAASAVCKPIPRDRARKRDENWHASNYSLRDLRLIGIVLRGTRSYAMLRDPSNYGNIVYRRDCVGKEKAIVEAITAGFIRLEVIPEAPPGGKTPEPEKREIALHPEDLQVPDEDVVDKGEVGGSAGGGQ